MPLIYLDNMATTPVDPRVLEAMLPFYREGFGNAASRDHVFGQVAREAVEKGRAEVAAAIGADPEEIVFTSGATESDNLALKGVVEARSPDRNQVITVATEHKAVLDSGKWLKQQGCPVTFLPVETDGLVDPKDLRAVITDRTALVSVMLANNEIGVVQPVRDLAQIAHDHGALFHTDAAQAVGKISVDVDELDVDFMSFTAHKLYGPKGIGALYVRRRGRETPIACEMHGGGHEGGLRSGTLNVAGIVAFGKACEIASEKLPEEAARLERLRARLWEKLCNELPGVKINGHPTHRLPGNLNVCFRDVDGEALLMGMEDVALSLGAACTSGSIEPSYVLKAIGLTPLEARGSVRFGIGRFNTEEEIDTAAGRVVETVRRLREMAEA